MEAVKQFNSELSSLYEIKPPISKAKMTSITKGAIRSIKYYKHVVQVCSQTQFISLLFDETMDDLKGIGRNWKNSIYVCSIAPLPNRWYFVYIYVSKEKKLCWWWYLMLFAECWEVHPEVPKRVQDPWPLCNRLHRAAVQTSVRARQRCFRS